MNDPLPLRAPTLLADGGAALSPVVAGCWRLCEWQLGVEERLRWISECVELGVTSFDHADVYGSYQAEQQFGAALARAPASLRRRLQLITKCGIRFPCAERPQNRLKFYDFSAGHIRASVDHSLSAFGVEQLELVLLHRPDYLMDPAEVAAVCLDLQQSGKVRHFGVSNFSVSQFALLDAYLRLSTNQIELSALHLAPLDDGTLDQSLALGRRPMIWSPLAGGRLVTDQGERSLRVRRALREVGHAHGLSVSGAAIAWVLRHPARPLPITGSRRIEEIRSAVAALDATLSREEWYQVLEAAAGAPVP